MGEDYLNLKAVAIQVYRRLSSDPVTAQAAYGIAVAVIRHALQCDLKICCHLLDDWLREEGL